MKVQNAPNYIPPEKRKYIKDYLSNSSINLTNVADKQQIIASFKSSNQVMMAQPDSHLGGTAKSNAKDF